MYLWIFVHNSRVGVNFGVPLSPGSVRPQKCSSCICLTHNFFSFLLIVYINEQTCQRNARFSIGITRNVKIISSFLFRYDQWIPISYSYT